MDFASFMNSLELIPSCFFYHRTIHGMVYNALKLYMDINNDLFDQCVHAFKQNVLAYVYSSSPFLSSSPI